jgi:hypothetical protein
MMMLGIIVVLFSVLVLVVSEDEVRRGIVIPIGPKPVHFAGAWATIKAIRQRYNSMLSVELWCYAGELQHFPTSVIKKIASEPLVEIKTIPVPLDTEKVIPDWDLKGEWYEDYLRFASMPLALIHTKLDEVIAMDADAVLMVDPASLFDTFQYHDTGTLFLWDKLIDYWPAWYPQYDKTWMYRFLLEFDNSRFTSIPLDTRTIDFINKKQRALFVAERAVTQHTMDSSLLVMDRRRHARTLAVLEELTVAQGANVYQHTYGDKETYWMAALLAGSSMSFNDWAVGHWSHPSYVNGTQVCRGTNLLEPGSVHFMPGETNEILVLNECKSIGCAQFGIRKLQYSSRISRGDHHRMYYGRGGKVRLPMFNGTLPRGTKDVEDGRRNPGVQRYHSLWYDRSECFKFPEADMSKLIEQRALMQAGIDIFCEIKSYCKRHHRYGQKNVNTRR